MINHSTLIHLRFPFSIFLLPIYLFAISQSPQIFVSDSIGVFIVLHLLVYPASNAYNSYFDKDIGSIGGVRTPPKVSKQLYNTALVLDAAAILISFWISWQFGIGILIYGFVSKAYSHPSIRLKKYPILGWLVIAIFQGFLIYLISYLAINRVDFLTAIKDAWIPSSLASLLLMGSYPMTQIYQHDEDKVRSDITISYKLGIYGTFHFTAIFFTISVIGFLRYFNMEGHWMGFFFLIFLLPTVLFFVSWYFRVRKDKRLANYDNTMRLNLISSISLSLFFLFASFYQM